MRKKAQVLITTLVFFASVLALAFTAKANIGGFTVSPVFPENQIPGSEGFFDVRIAPGQQQQEITVAVTNPGDEPIMVEISLITVGTNSNGILEYATSLPVDETMAYHFTDMARLPTEIAANGKLTIPPEQTAQIPIFIDIPAEGFDGVILGAVHVLRGISEQERAEAGMIVNRFAQALPVRMHGRELTGAPEFLLGAVGAENFNYAGAIVAEIRNPQPRLAMGVVANAQVYIDGFEAPVFVRSNVNVDFAPNSVFDFRMVDTMGYGLQAGDYTIDIQLEYNGQEWNFSHDFIVEPQEAAAINEGALNLQEQARPGAGGGAGGLSMPLLAGIGVGVLVIIALVIMLIKSKSGGGPQPVQSSEKLNADIDEHMKQKQLEEQKEQLVQEIAGQAQPDEREAVIARLRQMNQEQLTQLKQQMNQQSPD